jgi:hypothetical protein
MVYNLPAQAPAAAAADHHDHDTIDAYRKAAYGIILNMLQTHPCLDAPSSWDAASWAVFMGFEHERIHIETSSVLMREVP